MPSPYLAGPVQQHPVEGRRDVLSYTSEPLREPVAVTGPVSVTVHVDADAPDFDVVARLCDVDGHGNSVNVVDGIRRHRADCAAGPAAVVPSDTGAPYEIEIELWSTSHVFGIGHRIRLHVTSSAFPRWDAARRSGPRGGGGLSTGPVRLRVVHEPAAPSLLTLSTTTSPPGSRSLP